MKVLEGGAQFSTRVPLYAIKEHLRGGVTAWVAGLTNARLTWATSVYINLRVIDGGSDDSTQR